MQKNCPTAWDISGEASRRDGEASHPDGEASHSDAEASHPDEGIICFCKAWKLHPLLPLLQSLEASPTKLNQLVAHVGLFSTAQDELFSS